MFLRRCLCHIAVVAFSSCGSCSAAVPDVAARAAVALRAGRVLVEPNFLSGQQLQEARQAAAALAPGATAAVVGGQTTADKSVRDCDMLDLLDDDVWTALPSPLTDVVLAIDSLRKELMRTANRPLIESAELQLLRYQTGGRYARHVDDGLGTAFRPVRRSVSFLLYLTPDDWDVSRDGGVLRIHPFGKDDAHSESVVDVAPNAGTLVLFDSATVPHEVMPTQSPRTAIVGWFLEERTPQQS